MSLELIAYQYMETDLRIVPSSATAEWMKRTQNHFALRCLPMLVSCASGWAILNKHAVAITWTGSPYAQDLSIRGHHPACKTWLGYGTLTWDLPWLFRTPEGYSLQVRGPVNAPKDGIAALEGTVETDHTAASFAITWQFTRPGTIVFEEEEPIAFITPVKRDLVEQFMPQIRPLAEEPHLQAAHRAWVMDIYQTIARGDSAFRKAYFQEAEQQKVHPLPFVRKQQQEEEE